MPELLSTLPGDIPGLLRRGSPIVYSRFTASKAVVGETHGKQWREDNGPWQPCETWCLDLTDPTGRVHAAWWAQAHYIRQTPEVLVVYLLARSGGDMSPAQIDTLARLVLRLAGRAS